MYSGKPVSLAREATTLSWVLFHGEMIAEICRIGNQAFQPLALKNNVINNIRKKLFLTREAVLETIRICKDQNVRSEYQSGCEQE